MVDLNKPKQIILKENGYTVYLRPFIKGFTGFSFPLLGYGCGYVAVPENHRLQGVSYDDNRLDNIVVHGGLTFSDQEEFGWTFGFDTGHYGDNLSNCSEEYCKEQALNLYKELKDKS